MPRAAWRTCLHQHKAILDCRWVSPRTSSLVSSLSTLENMKNFVWSCHDHVQSFLYCSRIGILWNLPPFYIVLAYCGVAGWTAKRISILQYCLNCTVSWKSACCNLQMSYTVWTATDWACSAMFGFRGLWVIFLEFNLLHVAGHLVGMVFLRSAKTMPFPHWTQQWTGPTAPYSWYVSISKLSNHLRKSKLCCLLRREKCISPCSVQMSWRHGWIKQKWWMMFVGLRLP